MHVFARRCPESLQPGYEAGYAADLWALGCCLYLWAYGDLPFPGTVSFVIYEKIRVQVRRRPRVCWL